MSVVTALVAGGVFGVRHALEADHLAAVTALVDDDARGTTAGVVGASWGVGHALPIAALGLGSLVFGIEPPATVTHLFEAVVGLVLVSLGARLVAEVAGVVDVHQHRHGSHPLHRHLRVGDWALGATHVHGGSFAVGVLHGVAGSGVLVVALVASAPGVERALAFLAAFSLLSVATMAAVTALWSRSLDTGFTTYLKAAAGLVGVGVGLSMLVGQATGLGLL
jgi:hypothetical protein